MDFHLPVAALGVAHDGGRPHRAAGGVRPRRGCGRCSGGGGRGASRARGAQAHRPEWSDLVASLRKDIERRRVEPPQEKPKPDTLAPVPRRSRKSKPVQDEWGFFDPEQCGFAALLAKLDEITEGTEDKEVRQPS